MLFLLAAKLLAGACWDVELHCESEKKQLCNFAKFLTYFQNSVLVRLSSKFVIKSYLNMPPFKVWWNI